MDCKTLQQILDTNDFFHVAQPIVNIVENKVFGYELLFRSNHIQNTGAFFQLAKQENRLIDVDIMSIKKALQTVNQLHTEKNDIYWFINIQPQTIVYSTFIQELKQEIKQMKLDPSSVIFELNEDMNHVEIDELKKKIADLKKLGFFIALDDVGKVQSSLPSIFNLDPYLIKIDQSFTKDIALCSKKKRDIAKFTQLIGDESKMVFEGIENESDLQALKRIGAIFVQGYYLGKPKKLEFYIN